jgi:hypothetical protein
MKLKAAEEVLSYVAAQEGAAKPTAEDWGA